MGRLDVRLLGPFQVTLDGQPVTGFRSDKVRALLAYLCTEMAGPHRREKLAGMLWPDWPESSARANLRRALADLRSVISDHDATPPFLSVTPQTIAFNTASDAWVDVVALAELAGGGLGPIRDPSALEQAVALYRGEFLEGFSLPDSPLFEEWTLFHRERWHRLILEALQRLVEHCQQAGEYERGLSHAWHQVELDPWREESHQQLMLLLAATGQRSAALAQYETCRQVLAQELGTEPSAALRETYELLLKGERLPDLPLAPLALEREPRQLGPCPYRGLAAFREEDAPFFFGRETFTQRLAEAVQRQPVVAVIVGSSGCGKSSAIFAGLLPRLRDAGDWRIADLRPGADPFHALAGALLPILSPELDDTDRLLQARKMANALLEGDLPLADVLSLALEKQRGARRLLLFIDQFEELYTLCPDPEMRRCLVDTLLQAVASAGKGRVPRFVLLLTMRADFMGQALAHRPFADALQEATVMLGPMNRDELRAAIEEPAEVQGAAFESGLVERILDDVGQEPGNLPLLEFALTLLWERHHQGWLTHEGYEAIGCVEGALARYAGQVYAQLDEAEQASTRQILVQLVHPGEGTEDTRRVATRAEVGEENWGLVQHLADRRLVVTGRDAAGVQTVEVVHEAMIQSWGQLQGWIEEDRAFRTWQERLRTAERQWQRTKQDEGALLRGAPLAEAEGWLAEREDELSEGERSFVQAGVALRERRAAEREAQRQRELEAARQLAEERRQAAARLRRRALLLAGAMAVAVVLAALAFLAFRQAEEERQTTLARELAFASANSLDTDPERGLLLALEAVKAKPIVESTNAVHQALPELSVIRSIRTPGGIDDIDWSSDGTLIALAGDLGGRIILWDVASDRQASELTFPVMTYGKDVAFSPDDRLVAASGTTGEADLTLWDANTGEVLHTWVSQPGTKASFEGWSGEIAFSPDGSRLAVANLDGAPQVLDVSSGAVVLRLEGHTSVADGLAYSPDGSLIATGDNYENGEVIVWDAGTGRPLHVLEAEKIYSMAFSPDGRKLAAVGDLGILHVWDAATGEELIAPVSETSGYRAVAFSQDGERVYTGGQDSSVRIWDVASGENLRNLAGHTGVVGALAFSPDFRSFVSAGDDGCKFWDLGPGKELFVAPAGILGAPLTLTPDGLTLVAGGPGPTINRYDPQTGEKLQPFADVELGEGQSLVGAMRFTPNGRTLVISLNDGDVLVFDYPSGELLMTLEGHVAAVIGMDITSDGRYLVTASFDGKAIVWDLSDKTMVTEYTGHELWVLGVTFTPDDQRVLSASADKTVQVWDPLIGEPQRVITATGPVGTIQITPDGKYVLAAMVDGAANIWDAESWEVRRVFPAHASGSWGSALSADGTRWVTAGFEGSAKVWDIPSGEPVATLYGHQGNVTVVEISPDGKYVYSTCWGGLLHGFVLDVDELLALAESRVSRSLTDEECQTYLHLEACPEE